jgi:signal transduction histidine kinase
MVDSLEEAGRAIEDFHNRFNPGGAEFQLHSIDLVSTGEDLIQKYKRKYADSGISFSFENKLPAVECEGNPPANIKAICRLTDKVSEVIENLLDNAVQAVTARPSGAEGGAQGIGLWFCQLYVSQLGGKLTFASEEGKGSWFEIEFPTIDT